MQFLTCESNRLMLCSKDAAVERKKEVTTHADLAICYMVYYTYFYFIEKFEHCVFGMID